MTQEQYKRAVEINDRIKQLNEVLEEFEGADEHRLSYSYYNHGWSLCASWLMSQIGDILDKHDVMIRMEINEEIKKLENEIETL